MDIKRILTELPNTIVSLRAEDLEIFARQIVSDARQEFDREQKLKAKETAENMELLTAADVKSILDISDSTLYRLARSELLVPIWVGGQRRYTYDSLTRFLEGR